MLRLKRLVVALLLLVSAGTDVVLAVLLRTLGDGSHVVSIRAATGSLDIVFHHHLGGDPSHGAMISLEQPSDDDAQQFVPHSHDDHSAAHHHDHVIRLPGPARASMSGTGPSFTSSLCPVLLEIPPADPGMHGAVDALAACSGVDPPPPSRSSILRI